MRSWLFDDIQAYNESKALYKEVLQMQFDEDFLSRVHKDKPKNINENGPKITVEEALKTRNFTEEEEFAVLYGATIMYNIAKVRYKYRDMDIELFEQSIFPAYQQEITDKSSKGAVNITIIHRNTHKILMPKNLNANSDIPNFIVNVTFLYEDLLKTPLINPKTGNTYTGFDIITYSVFSETMKKRVIQDMLQCELFNYCLENGLDNKAANNIWNTYSWEVIINTLYKMYIEETKTLTENT